LIKPGERGCSEPGCTPGAWAAARRRGATGCELRAAKCRKVPAMQARQLAQGSITAYVPIALRVGVSTEMRASRG
jgi:hypothetical protein